MAEGLSSFFPALPAFFIITLFLLLFPTIRFLRNRNSAVLIYIFWLFFGNAFFLINMLVWKRNVRNVAPIYCDIVSSFLAMLPVGIACSLFCITRLVWRISGAGLQSIKPSVKSTIVDILIGIGIPLAFTFLRLLVQDKRFTIVEDAGCYPSILRELPALIVYFLPPSLISCCVTSIFCVLSFINFYKMRHRLNSLLMSNDSLPSFNRHLRLALLCTTSVAICSAFLLAILILNIGIGFTSSTSWKAWDFAHVDTITAKALDESPSRKVILALEMILTPVLSLHFFIFFGFIEEAMRRIRGHRFSTHSVLPEAWRRNHRPTELSHRHEAGIIEITPPSPTDHQFAVMPAPLAPTYSVTNHTTATATPTHSPPHSRPSSVLTHHGSVEPQSPLTPSLTHFPVPPPHFFHEPSILRLPTPPMPSHSFESTSNGPLDQPLIRQVSVYNVRDNIVAGEDSGNRLRPFLLDAYGTTVPRRDASVAPLNGASRRNGWPRYF